MAKKQKRARQPGSAIEKILKSLIRLTTIPREKSVIRWKMDKVFSTYHFETEYKGKIYAFDGRHFYVYPSGHELPPCIRIGDKSGPDVLLSVKISAMPELFGELWQQICGQHEKELIEDKIAEMHENKTIEARREVERKRALENTEKILKDFA